MPADTATPTLALLLMGTGNDDNTWGDLVNAQIIQYIEDALVGLTTKNSTGGAVTLSQAECRPSTVLFNNVLTSDLTVTIPTVTRPIVIWNDTAGAFSILVKTAAGSAVEIPQGTKKRLHVAGSTIYREDRERVGEYFYHAGSSAPSGALECNGAAILRASHPDLFTAIGTLHGVGNGTTTFNLPDAYTSGKFLRSRTASVAAGTAQTDLVAAHTHTASGTATTSLSGSVDAGGGHTPSLSSSSYSTTLSGTVDAQTHTHTGTTDSQNLDHTHSGTTSVESANHTHSYSGTTGDDSPDHTHDVSAATGTFNAQSGGGTATRTSTLNSAITSAGASVRHQHTYSGTSLGASASHDHTVTTGGMSANAAHQHGFSIAASGSHSHAVTGMGASTSCTAFTMNAVANHQHGVTGVSAATTITGVTVNANVGAETRPTNLSGILCVRY